ncbi:uncharacterized protein LOC111561345 [Felis catus]|uniref:uncharacterized protein LOC111561345 n=1 Tax=Felis catus TaxID=9685 RepID=UPI001D19ED33|nr:uncharacterized protein LOC111561345 [Felis catus]
MLKDGKASSSWTSPQGQDHDPEGQPHFSQFLPTSPGQTHENKNTVWKYVPDAGIERISDNLEYLQELSNTPGICESFHVSVCLRFLFTKDEPQATYKPMNMDKKWEFGLTPLMESHQQLARNKTLGAFGEDFLIISCSALKIVVAALLMYPLLPFLCLLGVDHHKPEVIGHLNLFDLIIALDEQGETSGSFFWDDGDSIAKHTNM